MARFIGKDPVRKGLDRFLRVVGTIPNAAARLQVSVIGIDPVILPAELRAVPGVVFLGHIDKSREPRRFLDVVGSHDVGILLSRAEAGGISLREFHALGLAVLAPDTGGSPEYVLPESSWLVKADAPDEAIRALVLELLEDPDRISRAKAAAWTRRREMGWDVASTSLGDILHETSTTPSHDIKSPVPSGSYALSACILDAV